MIRWAMYPAIKPRMIQLMTPMVPLLLLLRGEKLPGCIGNPDPAAKQPVRAQQHVDPWLQVICRHQKHRIGETLVANPKVAECVLPHGNGMRPHAAANRLPI